MTFLINTKDLEGFRAAGSLTWGGIHNTYFWIDLKRRITAVGMMQILPIGDPHVRETMIAFEQASMRRDRSQKIENSGQVEAANRVQVGPVVVVSGDAGGRR